MGHRYLAVLVAALLLVGHLILDLDGTRPRLDHLSCASRYVASAFPKPSINVGNDRHHVGLEVDQSASVTALHFSTSFPAFSSRVQLRGTGPPSSRASAWRKNGVELLDRALAPTSFSCIDWSGSGPKLRAKRRYHPARQVQIAFDRWFRSAS